MQKTINNDIENDTASQIEPLFKEYGFEKLAALADGHIRFGRVDKSSWFIVETSDGTLVIPIINAIDPLAGVQIVCPEQQHRPRRQPHTGNGTLG